MHAIRTMTAKVDHADFLWTSPLTDAAGCTRLHLVALLALGEQHYRHRRSYNERTQHSRTGRAQPRSSSPSLSRAQERELPDLLRRECRHRIRHMSLAVAVLNFAWGRKRSCRPPFFLSGTAWSTFAQAAVYTVIERCLLVEHPVPDIFVPARLFRTKPAQGDALLKNACPIRMAKCAGEDRSGRREQSCRLSPRLIRHLTAISYLAPPNCSPGRWIELFTQSTSWSLECF